MGEEVILKALEEIEDEKMKTLTIAKLEEIEKGKRDIYF